MNTYAFTLGRESKLSLAELFALFGEDSYDTHTDEIAIFSLQYEDSDIAAIFRNIGGSIRVMRVLDQTDEKRFPTDVISAIGQPEGKYTFALGVYGLEYRLSDIGLRIKKTLVESGISTRLVNTENKNIISAVWKREKLGRSKSEYSLIRMPDRDLLAITIACQDIDAYTKRDTMKTRDMVVGMMPPKLCQMMINLANGKEKKAIYDPFCGLGTILIEAANMGITSVVGSDLSPRMVASTDQSIREFVETEKMWQERIRVAWGTPAKDFSAFEADVFELDASRISRSTKDRIGNANIVSEGYLGEIMHQWSISLDKVKIERSKLRNMYDGFFGGLCGMDFSGNIVMTFPFWDIHGTMSFFTEIYDVIGRHGFEILPLLPVDTMRTTMTPKGSLLYKRPGQNVGREVIKMRLKKN